MNQKMKSKFLISSLCLLALTGCASSPSNYGKSADGGVKPAFSFPVTNNDTPYSQCLTELRKIKANNLPVFAVGEVADKTGQIDYDKNGHSLTQGVSEMVISALAKTGKANLVERLDLRIPLAEVKLSEQKRLSRNIDDYGRLPASDFIVVGALTELNYNIVSGGAQLFVKGIGGGGRTVIINVALDLRVINSRNFSISYVSTLQKQIYGYEVEANVFRFFGDTLVEFNAGAVRNEPMQLGVRSVVEMAVYQIMTDFLGLPVSKSCDLMRTDHMAKALEQIAPQPQNKEKDKPKSTPTPAPKT
jgi:curli production assembly/transport component CsgG/holdfast attachment protein HfaB